MAEEYKPRFSFEISEEQKNRADKLLIQYGLRKAVFGLILDDVLNMIEEHGQMVIGVLVAESTKPREIIPSLSKAERKSK